jgi:hypothetical protein
MRQLLWYENCETIGPTLLLTKLQQKDGNLKEGNLEGVKN